MAVALALKLPMYAQAPDDPFEHVIDLALAAESAGISAAYVIDHLLVPRSGSSAEQAPTFRGPTDAKGFHDYAGPSAEDFSAQGVILLGTSDEICRRLAPSRRE